MIDLHMHSMFSDGTFTPEELIAAGQAAGLRAMALTDHDTVGGIPRFLAAAEAAGMRAISGVEVSADPPSGTMHVLGYCVAPEDDNLRQHLKWIREGRDARNLEIIQRLNRLGIRISMDEVKQHALEEVVARPHFAQVLIEKGFAKDKKEAFDKYLARGKAAYVERRRLSPAAVMILIRSAGGVPVLAHPFSLQLGVAELKKLLAELKEAGLGGLECYYPEHTPEMTRKYLKIAKEIGLIASGGSDFHGAVSAHTKLGTGYGNLEVPDAVIDEILAARAA